MSRYFTRRTVIQVGLMGLFSNLGLNSLFGATSSVVGKITQVRDTNVSITVSAKSAVRVYVEYGLVKGKYSSKTPIESIKANTTKTLSINDLPSGKQIYLRVRYALLNRNSFLALPAISTMTKEISSNTVFAIQADPHMDENSSADVYNGTLAQIVASSPAFLMDLGDIFMVDKLADKSEKNIRARFELMKGFYNKLNGVPLKICLGNHDGELGYSKFNTKSYRQEYFPEQTGDLAYFSFTGPDQLHVVLDPFTYTVKNPTAAGWEWTLGKTQYDWLESTLTSSKATHKFIYIHHLLVGDAQSRGGSEIAKYNEWGGMNKDGSDGFAVNRPGWGKPIHQLLLENKVGFVFKGHDHLYVKQELDGIIYQTVPQPSHPGEKLDVTQYGYLSGKGVGGSGFLKVTTNNKEAQVDFIKFDGKLGDSYVRVAPNA